MRIGGIVNVTRGASLLCVFVLLAGQPLFCSDEAAFTYNQSGIRKLKEHDYRGAIEDLKKAHQYAPAQQQISRNLGVAYNNYGFALFAGKKADQAIEVLENALLYDPENVYTLYTLGQAYYQKQDVVRARDILERAYALNPSLEGLAALCERVRTESAEEEGLETVTTRHFTIAVPADLDLSRFGDVKVSLEEAYGRIAHFLGHSPAQKIVVVLYREGVYEQLLGERPSWALAVFDGKVRIPVGADRYSRDDVLRIIYHEVAHAILFDRSGGRVPQWLSEGVAGKAEDLALARPRAPIEKAIRRYGVVPLRKIPAVFLDTDDLNLVTFLYIQSYLLIDFIYRHKGAGGIGELISACAGGTDPVAAIERVCGMPIDECERQWRRSLYETYAPDLKYERLDR